MIKFKEFVSLIKLLRIDVFMALFMFGYGLVQVPHVELIQDKICLNELGADETLCATLTSGSPETVALQSRVLSMTTSIVNYQTLVATVPGIIQSFFFGFWIDKYPSHIRLLLIMPCVGLLVQALIMIYQCIYFEVAIIQSLWAHLAIGLGGGQSLVLAAAFTYAAKATPQKFRSIRFAIIDLFIFSAYPIAVNVSGKILAARPWFNREKRNFGAVFATSAVTLLVAIIWALIFIRDSGSSDEELDDEPKVKVSSISSEETSNTNSKSKTESVNDPSKSVTKSEKSDWTAFAEIFSFNNVTSTMKTLLRDRPNNGRKKVILLVFCVLIVFVSLVADSYFGFQYTEKAFLWDYKHYSDVYTYLQLVQSVCTLIGSWFLKNTLELDDAEVGAIGILSHFFGNLVKGIPTVACYITGSLAFSLSGIAIPATRSSLTRIIDFNEIGQTLALISCMQALGPLLASSLTTAMFTATIDTMPGATYQFLAVFVIPPLIVHLWINLTIDSQGNEKEVPKVTEKDEVRT